MSCSPNNKSISPQREIILMLCMLFTMCRVIHGVSRLAMLNIIFKYPNDLIFMFSHECDL